METIEDDIDNIANKNVACCSTIKNCSYYLIGLFHNLETLGNYFNNFYIILVYDNCDDNSEQLLNMYKKSSKHNVIVVNNEHNNSKYRTERIANSRNVCLNIIYNEIKDVDFHMMIDADNVNHFKWNINLILYYLTKDNWDSLSFNRDYYYDIWALSYDNFRYHCWGYNDYSNDVVAYMGKEIKKN